MSALTSRLIGCSGDGFLLISPVEVVPSSPQVSALSLGLKIISIPPSPPPLLLWQVTSPLLKFPVSLVWKAPNFLLFFILAYAVCQNWYELVTHFDRLKSSFFSKKMLCPLLATVSQLLTAWFQHLLAGAVSRRSLSKINISDSNMNKHKNEPSVHHSTFDAKTRPVCPWGLLF